MSSSISPKTWMQRLRHGTLQKLALLEQDPVEANLGEQRMAAIDLYVYSVYDDSLRFFLIIQI